MVNWSNRQTAMGRHKHFATDIVDPETAEPASVPVYKKTVVANAAAIRTLPTTPIEIVPPTEIVNYAAVPSIWYVPISAQVLLQRDNDFTVNDTSLPTPIWPNLV